MQNKICISRCLPACRTSITVCIGFLVYGRMVMYHILNTRNIQSAGGKVGRYQYGATAITEFVKRTFAVGLLHTAMEHVARELPGLQVPGNTLHAFTIIAEYQSGMIAEGTKQVIEGFQFVLLRRTTLCSRRRGARASGARKSSFMSREPEDGESPPTPANCGISSASVAERSTRFSVREAAR